MFSDSIQILKNGDLSGNDMPFRLTLPSGLDVFGVPTKNFYGGEWDLGPTWNYMVMTDRPFLVDTGRSGTTPEFYENLETCGLATSDIKTIMLSHGHEDHDGGLAEIAEASGAKIRAHGTYAPLIRYYPDEAPDGARSDFPASCWNCNMPDEFSAKYCLTYHKDRSLLEVEDILEGPDPSNPGITFHHLPGHTPDCVVIQIGDEALLLGDVVLPHISPFPSREDQFEKTSIVLGTKFGRAEELYGLRAYIKSLGQLKKLAGRLPGAVPLPGHRLYYNGQWNELDVPGRTDELIRHHAERCAGILDILSDGPKTAQNIALLHFPDKLLKGPGLKMAENEIHSHCELLMAAGDVRQVDNDRFEADGDTNFEGLIRHLGEL